MTPIVVMTIGVEEKAQRRDVEEARERWSCRRRSRSSAVRTCLTERCDPRRALPLPLVRMSLRLVFPP